MEKKINHFKWGDGYQTAITQPNYFVERRRLLRYNRTTAITAQKRRDYSADEIGQILTTDSDKS